MSWYEESGDTDLANQILITNTTETKARLDEFDNPKLLAFTRYLLIKNEFEDQVFPASIVNWYRGNGFITEKQKIGLRNYIFHTVFPLADVLECFERDQIDFRRGECQKS